MFILHGIVSNHTINKFANSYNQKGTNIWIFQKYTLAKFNLQVFYMYYVFQRLLLYNSHGVFLTFTEGWIFEKFFL